MRRLDLGPVAAAAAGVVAGQRCCHVPILADVSTEEAITRQQLHQLINQLQPEHVGMLGRIAAALLDLDQPTSCVLHAVPDQRIPATDAGADPGSPAVT